MFQDRESDSRCLLPIVMVQLQPAQDCRNGDQSILEMKGIDQLRFLGTITEVMFILILPIM